MGFSGVLVGQLSPHKRYFRYFKFDMIADSRILDQAVDVRIRQIKVMDEDDVEISITANTISTWTTINNIQDSLGTTASTGGLPASFYIDCDPAVAGTKPDHYEIVSEASSNPNRIPVKWNIYASDTTTFGATPQSTVDFLWYNWENLTSTQWDWRTEDTGYEWLSKYGYEMPNPMRVNNKGEFENPVAATGKVLWDTDDSDILCPQYTRFLRLNFGSATGPDPPPTPDTTSNTNVLNTFKLYS